MVGETLMPFGKYKGNSIAMIAMKDFPYLAYISDKIETNSLRREVARVMFALDNFDPQFKCSGGCEQKAARFSIAYYGGKWLIEDAEGYCLAEKCWNNTCLDGPRREEPMKYSALLPYALGGVFQQSRHSVMEFQNILNNCAGFRGALNERSAQTFIDDLVRKTGA